MVLHKQALTITKMAPIILMIINKDNIVTMATGAGLSKLKIINSNLEGNSIYKIFKDHPEAIQAYEITQKGGESDFILRVLDEVDTLYLDFHLNPFYENDEYAGQILSGSNITQLFNAQQRFVESETKYSTIINASPLGILVTRDFKCVYANPAFLEMFAFSPDFDIDDTSVTELFVPSVRDEMLRRSMNIEKGGNETPSFETTGLRVDNTTFPLQIFSNRIIYNKNPSVIQFFIDLSNIRQLEKEKNILHEQLLLSQKYESLGIVSSGVAHDFNNLLVGIMGNASLLQLDMKPSSPQSVLLREIQKIAMNAAKLTKQMIAYTNPTSNKLMNCNLTQVVEEITQLLSISIPNTIIIEYELENKISLINADVSQLQQMVLNLVINASESIGESNGKIIVKTFEDNGVCLEVVDNGEIIKQEDIENIFDPKFGFRGLGLTVVKGIVQTHHGIIDVLSDEENGTHFKITFPIEGNTKIINKKDNNGELPKGKILFCDDDARVREVGEKMLSYLDFEVIVACDGQEALDALEENKDIILVVLDLTMPVLSGRETLSRIREMSQAIPIIISSGHSEVIGEFEGRANIEFLLKPYTLNSFKETIAKLL